MDAFTDSLGRTMTYMIDSVAKNKNGEPKTYSIPEELQQSDPYPLGNPGYTYNALYSVETMQMLREYPLGVSWISEVLRSYDSGLMVFLFLLLLCWLIIPPFIGILFLITSYSKSNIRNSRPISVKEMNPRQRHVFILAAICFTVLVIFVAISVFANIKFYSRLNSKQESSLLGRFVKITKNARDFNSRNLIDAQNLAGKSTTSLHGKLSESIESALAEAYEDALRKSEINSILQTGQDIQQSLTILQSSMDFLYSEECEEYVEKLDKLDRFLKEHCTKMKNTTNKVIQTESLSYNSRNLVSKISEALVQLKKGLYSSTYDTKTYLEISDKRPVRPEKNLEFLKRLRLQGDIQNRILNHTMQFVRRKLDDMLPATDAYYSSGSFNLDYMWDSYKLMLKNGIKLFKSIEDSVGSMERDILILQFLLVYLPITCIAITGIVSFLMPTCPNSSCFDKTPPQPLQKPIDLADEIATLRHLNSHHQRKKHRIATRMEDVFSACSDMSDAEIVSQDLTIPTHQYAKFLFPSEEAGINKNFPPRVSYSNRYSDDMFSKRIQSSVAPLINSPTNNYGYMTSVQNSYDTPVNMRHEPGHRPVKEARRTNAMWIFTIIFVLIVLPNIAAIFASMTAGFLRLKVCGPVLDYEQNRALDHQLNREIRNFWTYYFRNIDQEMFSKTFRNGGSARRNIFTISPPKYVFKAISYINKHKNDLPGFFTLTGVKLRMNVSQLIGIHSFRYKYREEQRRLTDKMLDGMTQALLDSSIMDDTKTFISTWEGSTTKAVAWKTYWEESIKNADSRFMKTQQLHERLLKIFKAIKELDHKTEELNQMKSTGKFEYLIHPLKYILEMGVFPHGDKSVNFRHLDEKILPTLGIPKLLNVSKQLQKLSGEEYLQDRFKSLKSALVHTGLSDPKTESRIRRKFREYLSDSLDVIVQKFTQTTVNDILGKHFDVIMDELMRPSEQIGEIYKDLSLLTCGNATHDESVYHYTSAIGLQLSITVLLLQLFFFVIFLLWKCCYKTNGR